MLKRWAWGCSLSGISRGTLFMSYMHGLWSWSWHIKLSIYRLQMQVLFANRTLWRHVQFRLSLKKNRNFQTMDIKQVKQYPWWIRALLDSFEWVHAYIVHWFCFRIQFRSSNQHWFKKATQSNLRAKMDWALG